MNSSAAPIMDRVMGKPEFSSAFSEAVDTFIGLYILVVGVLSVITNIVVLWGLPKKKQDITDMDIININISICQTAAVILCYPLILVSAFSHGWSFSLVDCKWNGFFIFFFAMSTIGCLLLMTFYRHLRMFHGHLFHKRNVSRVRLMVCLGVAASYLYGLLWALPPLLGYGSYILEPHNMCCSLDWTSLPQPYTLGILVLGYLFPVCTMAGVYGRIMLTVQPTNQQKSPHSNGIFRRDYYVTIVCILHCAFFLLVWTPYAVLSFMTIFSLPVPSNLFITSSFFAKVDTLINPFVFFAIRRTMLKHTSEVHKDNLDGPTIKVCEEQEGALLPGLELVCAITQF